MKKLIFLFSSVLSFAFNELNIQLSNTTLGVYGQYKLNSYENNLYSRAFFLYNEDKDNFMFIGIKGEGNLIGVDENVKMSLIVDFVYSKNNSALPLGIGLFGYISQLQYPVFISGEFEFAPKILSFKDAERFSRGDIQLGIQPIENGKIFAGYRNISFNKTYNSEFYGGIGYNF